MIELWGMTEMVRVLGDTVEPRQVGTRAFGKAVPGIKVCVVGDGDRDVASGQPGEMLVRHSAETPRRGCFAGYLKDEAATETGWQGGWFHTGDVVWRGTDGMGSTSCTACPRRARRRSRSTISIPRAPIRVACRRSATCAP